jgi:hypothetical protein
VPPLFGFSGGGSGGGHFSPIVYGYPNCDFLVDPSEPSTLTITGGVVTSIADATGLDAVPITGTGGLTVDTSVQLGDFPALRVTTSNNLPLSKATQGTTGGLWALMCLCQTQTASIQYGSVMAMGAPLASLSRGLAAGNSSGTAWNSAGDGMTTIAYGTGDVTAPHLHMLICDGTNYTFYVDGQLVLQEAVSAFGGAITSAGITLGGWYVESDPFEPVDNTLIYCAAYWYRAPSPLEVAQTGAWMAAKSRITQ